MFKIEPDTLYSYKDLEAVAKDLGVTLQTFLAPLDIPKLYKGIVLGSVLLAALDQAYTVVENDLEARRKKSLTGLGPVVSFSPFSGVKGAKK